ncbi:hypothetical protein ACFQRD_04165 [Brachybacterium sp. GCM10030268]|uniref:maltokinase N-terminal cap-like domain-containing protein n=1 Tax=Brachybacterium sp. GCM10030268 TaxID=3273382 RepID=UPI0036069342
MATIHQAELTPSKSDMLRTFLESRSWGEAGELEVLGAYRFDDPEGEVGIECHVARVGETIFHLPLAYRGAPVADAEEHLIGLMEHSVLGQRYVYDGLQDEVVLDCFRRALCGQQQQAELEIVDAEGKPAGSRAQSVTLSLEVDEGEELPSAETLLDGAPFTVVRTVGELDGTVRLVAAWSDGSGVVAAY